jgi:hypothetical protein
MIRLRHLLLLPVALVFAAMMPTGCGGAASCESICSEGQSRSCTNITGDCSVFCAALEKITMNGNCTVQYDNYDLCVSQDDICTGDSRCKGQKSALSTCVGTWCVANLGNVDCQTVGAALQ